MKISSKPIAIIKSGDRQLQFVRITKYADKYFSTKDGQTFELDDEYEYRLRNKTSIYIYNHGNSKPLSLSATGEVDAKLRAVGSAQLGNAAKFVADREDKIQALSDYQQLMANQPNIDPRIMQEIEEMAVDLTSVKSMPKDYTTELSKPTQRFLQDFARADEASVTNIFAEVHHQKRAIKAFSSPLIGMGKNTGSFAIIQVAYKRLDITRMVVNGNRAYTKYGVFEFDIDNVYLYKKQQIAFFILNDKNSEGLALPIPKQAQKMQNKMIRKKQWKLLETFNKPNAKKIAKPKKQTIIKILRIERGIPGAEEPDTQELIPSTEPEYDVEDDLYQYQEEELQDIAEEQDTELEKEITQEKIEETPEIYDEPEPEPEIELPVVPIDDAIIPEE
jgi:hypothetical protein